MIERGIAVAVITLTVWCTLRLFDFWWNDFRKKEQRIATLTRFTFWVFRHIVVRLRQYTLKLEGQPPADEIKFTWGIKQPQDEEDLPLDIATGE